MFKEFLRENYSITEEQFENLDIYNKRIIEREWEAYVNSLVH